MVGGTLGVTCLSSAYVALAFLKAPEGASREEAVDIGPLSELPVGRARVVEVADTSVIVIHDETEGLIGLSAICPHLGCVVAWDEDPGPDSLPPCHAGLFDTRGNVLARSATVAAAAFSCQRCLRQHHRGGGVDVGDDRGIGGRIRALIHRSPTLERAARVLSATVLYSELDERLSFSEALGAALRKPVPNHAFKSTFCLGGMALICFINQIITRHPALCLLRALNRWRLPERDVHLERGAPSAGWFASFTHGELTS